MIIAVGCDERSPGVTTIAATLTLVRPGDKVLVEADPGGADLPFRLRGTDLAQHLRPDPGIGSLATEARSGLAGAVSSYRQRCSLGFDVVPGTMNCDEPLWPG